MDDRMERRALIEEYYENAKRNRIKAQNTTMEINNNYNPAPKSNFIVGADDGLYASSKA